MLDKRLVLLSALGLCACNPVPRPDTPSTSAPTVAPSSAASVAGTAPAPAQSEPAAPAASAQVPAAPSASPEVAALAPAAATPPATPSAPVAPVSPLPRSARVAHASQRRVAARPEADSTSAELSGRIELIGKSGQPISAGDMANTLVYFVPASGTSRVHAGTYTVYTVNRDFKPEAMAIPLGSTVKFVNLDQIRHNVFSVTPGGAFDLGFQAAGQTATHSFDRAGLMLISCNVHRSMELDLLVVPSPYRTTASADGHFSLRHLPPGPGALYVWNPRGELQKRSVTAPLGDLHERVVISKPAIVTDINPEPGP